MVKVMMKGWGCDHWGGDLMMGDLQNERHRLQSPPAPGSALLRPFVMIISVDVILPQTPQQLPEVGASFFQSTPHPSIPGTASHSRRMNNNKDAR